MKQTWWKEGIVYQVYPRSFMDSNGDGIGDLQGVISRLDYIKSLGVDIIWLCPVYKSPNDDNGYDISDYKDIMDEFGTMEDWDELLAQVHKRGLKLIMDLVVNHSSDEHEWFIESRKSKDNPYRDYYIWKKGKDGKEPNNWFSVFRGSAWEYDKETEEYYLHLFSKKQPDLNWENPELREEIFSMMRWWLDKGIDGFRMDVINFIAKNQDFPDSLADHGFGNFHDFSINQPKMLDYLAEMNNKVLSDYDCMSVGECAHTDVEDAINIAGEANKRLNMIFSFDHMFIDMADSRFVHRDWSIREFKDIFIKWHEALYEKAWSSVYLGNHDFPRMVSRFADDSRYWSESAKMLATFLLTMPGTVYIYQGDEIGMTNCAFDNLDDYRDIEIHNFVKEQREASVSEEELLHVIRDKNRDNARTPFQWDGSDNAGFSTGTPWIGVNSNYPKINAASQENDPDSILNFYRKMIKIRKAHSVLTYGKFNVIDRENEELFLYIREDNGQKFFVILNFSGKSVELIADAPSLDSASLLISNYAEPDKKTVQPYEASVYSL